MKFLFVGAGYPDIPQASSGSGIGRYVEAMATGLCADGHACDVLVWGGGNSIAPVVRDGVRVFSMPRRRWRFVDRFSPEIGNVHARRIAVRRLQSLHHYDWIEVEHDEGIEIGVIRDFPERTLVRVHTPLVTMIETKRIPITGQARRCLARERRALRRARHVVTHSEAHATELARVFPFLTHIHTVWHGLDSPWREEGAAVKPAPAIPRFLVVGTPDLRKGFDRIRPVAAAYGARYGACELRIVSDMPESVAAEFGLVPPWPENVTITSLSRLSDDQLWAEYRDATALLHLARYESFGLPLIEAAAAGTPVVATETGIARELLDGELRRFVVDGDDPQRCAAALAEAAASRSHVGRQLRGKHRRQFSRQAMVRSYLAMLTSIGGSQAAALIATPTLQREIA